MVTTLVGTDDGLHRIDPSGELRGVDLGGQAVMAIAPEGSGWWAIVDADSLWRSTGGSWELAASIRGTRANCLAWTSAGLLVGTSEAGLYRWADGALQRVDSFDEVEGRAKWYTPWGGPPDSRSISEATDGAIYVNVHVGGIVRSRDAGTSWEPTIDVDSDVHQVLAPEGRRAGLVLAACAQGLAVSEDGGDSWRFDTQGLHGPYCRAVAVSGETVFVTASEGHRGRRAAVYQRDLAGGAFVKCSEGLPEWFEGNVNTLCLAASGNLVAFGTEQGQVFVSEDRGATWGQIANGLGGVRCLALA
jgi:photosystem II stability/assembly factor-like uncharacterized protein